MMWHQKIDQTNMSFFILNGCGILHFLVEWHTVWAAYEEQRQKSETCDRLKSGKTQPTVAPKRGTDDHGISIDHDNHDHDDHNDHDDHGISIELWCCKQRPPEDKPGLVCISTTPLQRV